MPVYFIRAGEDGPVKIGHASNPEARRRGLSTGAATPLHLIRTVPGGRPEEASFHSLYAELRLRGEWFKWTNGMLTDIPVAPSPPKPAAPKWQSFTGMTDIEALDFLTTRFGTAKELAGALNVTPQVLANWRTERGISAGQRAAVWAMVNDKGGNLPREWLMVKAA